MISAFKRLWEDRSGNALVLVGASLPVLVGFAGLATDTVQWALWKRQLQRAVDSSAMAGVYAVKAGQSYDTLAKSDFSSNNKTGFTVTPTVTQPTVAGYTNAVRVTASVQRQLAFSSMFMSTTPTITATATAAVSREGSYCVMALNNTTTASIQGNGNIDLDMGCGIISNSTSTTAAISISGNSHSINATPIAGVGKVPSINGTNTELSYQLKQSDPYAGKYSTTSPGGCKALSLDSDKKKTTKIKPGCYTSFDIKNATVALEPGTYYLENADFDAGANANVTVDSTDMSKGVTIILTGSSPGSVQMGSNSNVDLRAPSDGTTYNKMLFIQKSGASASSLINGNASSKLDGTIYLPSTSVEYKGGGASSFKCAMIVANIVSFQGNSSIQNNTTGCNAASQQTVERVRLVG